jgi:hypothetical protein
VDRAGGLGGNLAGVPFTETERGRDLHNVEFAGSKRQLFFLAQSDELDTLSGIDPSR